MQFSAMVVGGWPDKPRRKRKPCDGTWQDYRRHLRHGEDACTESKRSWLRYVAGKRKK